MYEYIQIKTFLKFVYEYYSQMINYKYCDNAKLWGYIRQI
jgi:hypothetical protein